MHFFLVGSDVLLHKVVVSLLLLVVVAVSAGFVGSHLPTGFIPEEDQGYFYMNVQLPTASSLQRTDDVANSIEAI
jgi:HAE1 family hydrophobic/amphiphilic exporter-1